MTAPFTPDDHCSNDVLVRFIDDELGVPEAARIEEHLASCSSCKEKYLELRRTSSSFDSFIESLRPQYAVSEREALGAKLDVAETKRSPVVYMRPARRIGWGLGMAAALAIGVLYFASGKKASDGSQKGQLVSQSVSAFEIDGETFVALPFSNPELPLTSSRIVQMQVPVSSLADAGVPFEPITSRVSAQDRSVLADVLLGLDGQPLAVHVVSLD